MEVIMAPKELSSRGAEGRVTLDVFEKSQTAWFSYQGAECQAVAENWAGGTGQRVALVFCLTEHIRQRAFEIWRNYHLEQLLTRIQTLLILARGRNADPLSQA